MTTQYRDGNVTVTLSGELEGFVTRLLDATQSETVKAARLAADEIATAARAAWYAPGSVERETGSSGDIRVVTTIEAARGEIRLSVGSTDRRTAGGRPVPVYVHRPRATSTILKVVTPREYFAAPASMRGPWKPIGGKRVPQIFVPNPGASDGKFLLQTLVRGPVKARVAKLGLTISSAIRQRVQRG